MEELNPSYKAKSNRKTKKDYIDKLQTLVYELASELTVKELRSLSVKDARS